MFALNFDNSYVRLPANFYTKQNAEGFADAPFLIHGNPAGAALIGLGADAFSHPDFASYFSGNKNLRGSDPLAMVYAGHQFGVWAGQLGDGRALLLGQARGEGGNLWDIQLKGSGLTPYSRMGDGRAVLRSCIREYLCGEALHALGIPTTRSLCIVGTGQSVRRETMEPGAILTRLSPSHVRFGHFEHFFHSGQIAAVRQLADYVIAQHFPDLTESQNRYSEWFAAIVNRTAHLMAQWQAFGFAHGVMNTDNMSILGLTIDFGPFGFVEGFDPGFVCNHSDDLGRYAFSNQPAVGFWNLQALAYALQPLISLEESRDILRQYQTSLVDIYDGLMATRLGLSAPTPDDRQLHQSLLRLMHKHSADYTLALRSLADVSPTSDNTRWLAFFQHDPAAQSWLEQYFVRMSSESPDRPTRMRRSNPKYILRNWVAETAIRAAQDRQDYSVIGETLDILRAPFDEHPVKTADFAAPAPSDMRYLSVSCSS